MGCCDSRPPLAAAVAATTTVPPAAFSHWLVNPAVGGGADNEEGLGVGALPPPDATPRCGCRVDSSDAAVDDDACPATAVPLPSVGAPSCDCTVPASLNSLSASGTVDCHSSPKMTCHEYSSAWFTQRSSSRCTAQHIHTHARTHAQQLHPLSRAGCITTQKERQRRAMHTARNAPTSVPTPGEPDTSQPAAVAHDQHSRRTSSSTTP